MAFITYDVGWKDKFIASVAGAETGQMERAIAPPTDIHTHSHGCNIDTYHPFTTQ